MPRGASKRAPQLFYLGTCLGVAYRRSAMVLTLLLINTRFVHFNFKYVVSIIQLSSNNLQNVSDTETIIGDSHYEKLETYETL